MQDHLDQEMRELEKEQMMEVICGEVVCSKVHEGTGLVENKEGMMGATEEEKVLGKGDVMMAKPECGPKVLTPPEHTPEERSKALKQILSKYWGYDSFRGEQEAAVLRGVEGRDAFICMATGGGKSICYQIPPLYTGRTTVVISPLLSLMADQVFTLTAHGVSAAYLGPLTESRLIEEKFLSGQLNLLYLTPERLALTLDLMKTAVQKKLIGLFAVDEAHCISEWGHEFRKEFRQVSALRERYPEIPIMALTATATKAVQKDIIQVLRLNEPLVVRSSFNRPNLHFEVRLKTDMRQDLLDAFEEISRFTNTEQPSVLIYCPVINETEKIRSCLTKIGIKAVTYHGKVPLEMRDTAHKDFIHGHVQVIVATSAFGMGVDKPNTRGVINYGIAKSIETYYQQAGRAGRDGAPAKSIMFYKPGDFHTWGAMAQKMDNSLEQEAEARRLQKMQFLAATTTCRRKIVVEYFDDELDPSQLKEWCCDNCEKTDWVTKNLIDDSVLLLKAVRLRNRFGRAIPIDMLCGLGTKSVKQYRLDQEKSFFGKGVHHTRAWWKALATVLMEKKLLMESVAHGCKLCKISESGRELVASYDRAKLVISSGKPNPPALPTLEIILTDEMLAAEMPSKSKPAEFGSEEEKKLFLEMKILRAQLSSSANFPPLMDATLHQLCQIRPTNAPNFVAIKGIGKVKLERYGKPFMRLIKSLSEKYGLKTDLTNPKSSSLSPFPLVPRSPSVPGALRALIDLWNQGKSVREISSIRNEVTDAIYTQIAQLVMIHGCEIDLATPQLQLDPNQMKIVHEALGKWASRFGDSTLPSPRKLHEQLDGDYSFGMLKLILTVHQKKRDSLKKKSQASFDPLTSPRKCSTQVPVTKPYVPAAMDDEIEEEGFWEELVRTCPDLGSPQTTSPNMQSQQLPSPRTLSPKGFDPKRKRIEGSQDGLVAKRPRSTQLQPQLYSPTHPKPGPVAFSQPPPLSPKPKFSQAALSLATVSFQPPPLSPTLSPLSPTLSPEPPQTPMSPQPRASLSQRTPSRAPFIPSISTPPSSPLSQQSPSSQRSPVLSPRPPTKKSFSQSPPISSPQKSLSPTLLPSPQITSSPYFSKSPSSPKPTSPNLSPLNPPIRTSPQPQKPVSPTPLPTSPLPHKPTSPAPTSPLPHRPTPPTFSSKPHSTPLSSPQKLFSATSPSKLPPQTPPPTSPSTPSRSFPAHLQTPGLRSTPPPSQKPPFPSPQKYIATPPSPKPNTFLAQSPQRTPQISPSTPFPRTFSTPPQHTPQPPTPTTSKSPSLAPRQPTPTTPSPRPNPSSPLNIPPRSKSVSPCTANRSPVPPFAQSSVSTPPPNKQPPRKPVTQTLYPTPQPYEPSEKSKARARLFQEFQESIPMTDSLSERRKLSRPSSSMSQLGSRKTVGNRIERISERRAPREPISHFSRRNFGRIEPLTPAKQACPVRASPTKVREKSTPQPQQRKQAERPHPARTAPSPSSVPTPANPPPERQTPRPRPIRQNGSPQMRQTNGSPQMRQPNVSPQVRQTTQRQDPRTTPQGPVRQTNGPPQIRQAIRSPQIRATGATQPSGPRQDPRTTPQGPVRPANGLAQQGRQNVPKSASLPKPVPLPKPTPPKECKVENVSEYIMGAAVGGITEGDILAHFGGQASEKTVAVALDQLQLQFSVYKNGDLYFSM